MTWVNALVRTVLRTQTDLFHSISVCEEKVAYHCVKDFHGKFLRERHTPVRRAAGLVLSTVRAAWPLGIVLEFNGSPAAELLSELRHERRSGGADSPTLEDYDARPPNTDLQLP